MSITAANASQFAQGKIGDAILRNIAFTPPATLYLALFTVGPDSAGGGTEVTTVGTAYVRQSIAFGASTGNDPKQWVNSADVLFAIATANYGTVVGFALYDDPTAGNRWVYGTLDNPETINTGGQFKMLSGKFVVKAD